MKIAWLIRGAVIGLTGIARHPRVYSRARLARRPTRQTATVAVSEVARAFENKGARYSNATKNQPVEVLKIIKKLFCAAGMREKCVLFVNLTLKYGENVSFW